MAAAAGATQFSGGMPGNSIPLSHLIEHMIQRTYHDLTVLSELLPRKTDMERKTEIAQFASRTRQMFVRLLALVKWASSTSKVDKCAMISNFLDQQAMLFTETADLLARMARETLVGARLPAFSIPCAVDVLTTGTFPRLPACIKEKILPPDPITPQEKRKTLGRLNQIIEYRVVSSDLPARMRRPEIKNGRVIFLVENEFRASLTLMGDKPDIPWRLLDIDILVEDPEMGEGMALVHSMQVGYIHEVVQSRLLDSERPLHDLYDILHSFCQSLQLEVLFAQAQRLISQRMGDAVRIEEYKRGKSLVISYWKDQHTGSGVFQPNYKLCVSVDEDDCSLPLQVIHTPQLTQDPTKRSQPIKSDCLSMERVLIKAMQQRGMQQLRDLERELRLLTPGPPYVRGVPSALYAPLLYPPLEHEGLTVLSDMQTGKLQVALGIYQENELTKEIQNSLNGDRRKLRPLLSRLRLWLALERCRRSAEQLPANCFRQLPLCNPSTHPVCKLADNHLFIRLPSHNHFYLVVEAVELSRRIIEHRYHLLEVVNIGPPATTGADGNGEVKKQEPGSSQVQEPKLYMKAGDLVALEKFMCTHSAGTALFEVEPEDPILLNRKRKLFRQSAGQKPKKRSRPGSHSLPELHYMISQCENKLPLVLLAKEFEKLGVQHAGITANEDNGCVEVLVQGLPDLTDLKREPLKTFKRSFLGGCVQAYWNSSTQPCWMMEVLFCDTPVKSFCLESPGPVLRVQFCYSMCSLASVAQCAEALMDDWRALARLYDLVHDFATAYKATFQFQKEIKVVKYDLKRLTIAYGPKFEYTMAVEQETKTKQFKLYFACQGDSATYNPHNLTAVYLQRMLNEQSIVSLIQVLLDTWHPLRSLSRLDILPHIYVSTRGGPPTASFLVLPQSPTHVHLSFRHEYTLDIHLKGNRHVSIRDAAFGMFNITKALEGLTPIQQLKNFLTLYMDSNESARRRSTTEDDHPPTPENSSESFFDSLFGGGPGSPTMSGPSTSSQGLMNRPHPSPGMNFNLTSPPSVGNMMGPSPSMLAPSPGNQMAPSPMNPSPLSMSMQSPAMSMMQQGTGATSLTSPHTQRSLPQRFWAASVPTSLSHNAFERLLTPSSLSGAREGQEEETVCPLERFFGSNSLRRMLTRLVQSELQNMLKQAGQEAGVYQLKNSEGLIYRVALHATHQLSLCLKVATSPEASQAWSKEELLILERFFELKVASPPYRTNAIHSFARLMGMPTRFLKEVVKVMRLDMNPEPNQRWFVNFCMTVPYNVPIPSFEAGPPAVVCKEKLLIIVQLRSRPGTGRDNEVVVLPVLHVANENATKIILQEMTHPQLQQAAAEIIKPFNNFTPTSPQPIDCTLYSAISQIVTTL